jgi:hypothetical protein
MRADAVELPATVAGLQRAKEIDLGAFCITNLPSGSIKVGDSIERPDGTWWEIRVDVPRSLRRRPSIFFFAEPPAPVEGGAFEPCSNSRGKIASILDGRLNYASMQAIYKPATGQESNRWQVEPNKLDLEVGQVYTRLRTLFGGTLQPTAGSGGNLAGRLLWVKNPDARIFYNLSARRQDGILRLATTDVELANVRLVLAPGLDAIISTLRCPSGEARPAKGRVQFSVDVADGRLRFVDGQCDASSIPLPPGTLRLAGLELANKALKAGLVRLVGQPTTPTLSVERITGIVDTVSHAAPRVTLKTSKEVTVRALAGTVDSNTEGEIRFGTATWNDFAATGTIAYGEPSAITGTGELAIRQLSDTNLDADLRVTDPLLPLLAGVVAVDTARLEVTANGRKEAPSISGAAQIKTIRIASMAVAGATEPLTFNSTPGHTPDGSLPFAWDLKTPAGRLMLGNPSGQNVTLQGQLSRFVLKGRLLFPGPQVVIDPGGLVAEISAQASVSEMVLGSPVRFVSARLGATAPDGFTVSMESSKGFIDLETAAVIVATPSLAFADPNKNFIIQAPLATSGQTTFRFDVANGHTTIRSASIHAKSVTAKALADQPVRVADLVLDAPFVTLAALDAEFKDGEGTAVLTNLAFQAKSVKHTAAPEWAAEFADAQGFRLPTARARLTESDKALNAVDGVVEGLSLTAATGSYRSADGFTIRGQNIAVTADKLSETHVMKGRVALGAGDLAVSTAHDGNTTNAKARFEAFTVDVDGPKDKATGQGSVRVKDLSVGGRYRLEVGKCPEKDRWKVTGAVDVDQIDLGLQVTEGQMAGSAQLTQGKAYVVNDGYSRCEWDEPHTFVEEKWAIFHVPCWNNGPAMCEVKTIVVPKIAAVIHWVAELHQLQASATITNAEARLGRGNGLVVCVRDTQLNPPIIVANYHPNIREGGFVENLLRDLVRGVATLFESELANMAGSGAAVATTVSRLFPEVCAR